MTSAISGWIMTAAMVLGAPEGVHIEHVIGPEKPGEYKHPASLTQLDNGDLLVSYYGGTGEYEDDSKVHALRRPIDSDTWTDPVVIADTPFQGEGNPVVWQAPDGLVWLFYVQRYGDTWSEARVKAKISRDGAETWSDSMNLTFEKGTMVRGLPIVLNDGDYLLPLYHETGHDHSRVGPDTTSFFLRHNPETRTWTETNKVHSDNGNLQAEPVQIDDDYLFAFARRGGGYGPDETGYIIRMESRDGGHTWSRGANTEFPNPNAAISLIKLENGHLVLAYNHSMNARTPLTVALSKDDGVTWPYSRNIADDENTYGYPMLVQTRDGLIRLLYTTDHRKSIKIASFEESFITGE